MGVYHDPDVLALIEFGFAVNFEKTISVGSQHSRNHKGAQELHQPRCPDSASGGEKALLT